MGTPGRSGKWEGRKVDVCKRPRSVPLTRMTLLLKVGGHGKAPVRGVWGIRGEGNVDEAAEVRKKRFRDEAAAGAFKGASK